MAPTTLRPMLFGRAMRPATETRVVGQNSHASPQVRLAEMPSTTHSSLLPFPGYFLRTAIVGISVDSFLTLQVNLHGQRWFSSP